MMLKRFCSASGREVPDAGGRVFDGSSMLAVELALTFATTTTSHAMQAAQ
jgi:hypothetical protein